MSKVLSVLIAGIFATTAGIAAAQDTKKGEPTKAAPAATTPAAKTEAPKADAPKADATKAAPAADAKKSAKSDKGTEKKDKK